jgi:proteic killer suppression protein
MILSFKDKDSERVWNQETVRRYPERVQRIALRKLFMIEHARNLMDLRTPPGNRLESLKGDRAGQWSIRINDQWRICFFWDRGNATELEIADYH